jgi:hypothetical protein
MNSVRADQWTCAAMKLCSEMELRRFKRYRLNQPAFFGWERADEIWQQSQGTTRDISNCGVFVYAEILPAPGEHLKVGVHLPSVDGTHQSVHLCGEGTVVHVMEVGRSGFAAEVMLQIDSSGAATILGVGDIPI